MKRDHHFPVGGALAGLSLILFIAGQSRAQDQKTKPATRKSPASSSVQPKRKQSPPSPAPATIAQPPAENKPPVTTKELIEQGKKLYVTAKYKPALQKFEAALKLEPQHDEALGLAAITAFRVDLQSKARELFQRRAQLPDQKASVRAYCDYWSALTRWREAHDLIARSGELKQGHMTYRLKEKDEALVREHITRGLEDVNRALALRADYADALNVRNLLHAEAALIAIDEVKANEQRKLSLEALRKVIGYFQQASQTKGPVTADFGAPTIRVSEFPMDPDEDALLDDPMLLKLEGGRPIKRASAVIPPYRPPASKDETTDPAASGVTSSGGAVSVGPGRGALFGQLVPGIVKVEILVGTDGKVVFAQQVSGRPEIGGLGVAAAKKWTFQPARFEGKPVQISGVITFDIKASKARPAASPTPAPPAPKTN
jgi:tetratricopeptide (TPR) repeat protein